MYLEVAIVMFIYFVVVFGIGQILEDNSIVDIAWGLSYVIAALYSYLRGGTYGLRATLITVFILVWGLRLTYHIAKRNMGKPEDYRYVAMRKRWGNRLPRVKAFFNVYFLQYVIMMVVSLPVVYGNVSVDQGIGLVAIIGIIVWATGFFFESVGDAQLKKFKADIKNKGKLMDKGLWSLTRHPNYFGDAAMWFGIFFIAITALSGIWIIIGPALMAFFLRNVSGAMLLEKKYVGRADYDAYKERTNMFFPWLRKKV